MLPVGEHLSAIPNLTASATQQLQKDNKDSRDSVNSDTYEGGCLDLPRISTSHQGLKMLPMNIEYCPSLEAWSSLAFTSAPGRNFGEGTGRQKDISTDLNLLLAK